MSNIMDASALAERELFGSRKLDYPIAACPNHKVVTCSYLASKAAYSRRLMSSPWEDDPTFLLVDEQIEKTTGDLVYFSRKWANVPDVWNDAASIAFTYPGIDIGVTEPNVQRFPLSLPVIARVENRYFLTLTPFSDIAVFRKFSVINEYGYEFEYLGGPTAPSLATYLGWVASKNEIVAQDSSLERYLGDIWVRKTPYIPAR
jgi:hypothetical protein